MADTTVRAIGVPNLKLNEEVAERPQVRNPFDGNVDAKAILYLHHVSEVHDAVPFRNRLIRS